MHICFVEDTYLHGGTQIWVAEAMRAFMARGHDVTLLTAAGGFNATDGATTDAMVVTYDWDEVVAQNGDHQRVWTEALEPADVAICTVHQPRHGFHCSRFAAKCIADAGLPAVLQPKTGTIVPEYRREYYAPPEDIRYQVICITEFTRDYVVETYGVPAERVSLIYQGTDIETFTPDPERVATARERYPLPPDASPVIGNLGSFEPRKGQAQLLEAFAHVCRSIPTAHLVLVGDGPDEQKLRAAVSAAGLGDNVTFFPFTREPVYVFELLDMLVLSSLNKEGLPNVLLEALAMAVPVVSTRLAGTPEVVHDGSTGLLIEPGNVPALAAAIERLGTDPATRRAMGAAGRELMTAQFDKRHQFDAFLQHFASHEHAARGRP